MAVQYFYDPVGRLTSVHYEDLSRVVYNYDTLGNLTITYEIPACCSPHYYVLEKSGNFTASDGSGSYYRILASALVTLPASAGDGSVMKFKVLGGTASFVFAEVTDLFFHANGANNQNLVLTARSGVLEAVSVPGGYEEA